jgi:hypothetical protein
MNLTVLAFPLLLSEVSSGNAMVDVLGTPGREANNVDGSLEAVSLVSGISGEVPAVTVD